MNHEIDTEVSRATNEWNAYQGSYLKLGELLTLIPHHDPLLQMLKDYLTVFAKAPGSGHNHQAWEGGYLDHVVETMNIACQLYHAFQNPGCKRYMPFTLADALTVMFLHDLEKPFKRFNKLFKLETKQERRDFRDKIVRERGITLSEAQQNALRYVEGVPDSEYTAGERTMGELAAFCHCCDILSARLWYEYGKEQRWNEEDQTH